MPFQIELTDARRQAMRAAGLWPDRILLDWFDEVVRTAPARTAIVAASAESDGRTRLSYAELADRVRRIASGLVRLGVGRGDVVSVQLPNGWQFVAVCLACVRIGAVCNPLMPIFRSRELRYMLDFAQSRVVIAPARFRGFDYAAMYQGLRPALPALRHVLLVGGAGERSFERVLLDPAADAGDAASALFSARRPRPDDLTELIYTSGTSGEPKAVMHTSNTLLGTVLRYIEAVGLGPGDVVFMASPLAHQTGFGYGMMIAILLGTKLVLLDAWSAAAAARLVEDEGATFTMASTPFLADLAATPDDEAHRLKTLRVFVCAGAPIPSVLVERATERLGFAVLSCWGMTENGAVTVARPDDARDKITGTDGRALPGMEVRVIDDARRPLPAGTVGHLQARGPATFVGYLKKPGLAAIDADGWFDTGDLARMDADGYIRITGRSKDVIIRGGENVPVVEVENVLYRHPAVQDAALVAMPDARLGERACAFVVLRPGMPFDIAAMLAYLEREGMAKTYWPERLEVIDVMPRTPSGKIQKFVLRAQVAGFGAGS